MSPSPPRQRHLSYKLLQRIVLAALLCMLLMGGLKVLLTYRQMQEEIRRTVQMVGENSQHLLATALWDIEVDAVQRQVDWLHDLVEVDWVRVQSSTGQVFIAGKVDLQSNPPPLVFPILAPSSSSQLGTLELAPNGEYFSGRMYRVVLSVIVDYLVLTLLICLIVGWVLRRQLEHPLQQIARFVNQLKPNELAQSLVVNRHRHSDTVDEIDLVVQGFNRMQADLRNHIEALDDAVLDRTHQLSAALEEIRQLSQTDALTGCFNRRMFDQRLPAELERSNRYQRKLALVFVDIDHFKTINDAHGHAAGDAVLRTIAERLSTSVRMQVDWVVRYGGEEFIIVLPERDGAAGCMLAERLRQLIEATPVPIEGGRILVTASFGVAEYRPGDTAAQLIGRADAALYRAKENGRNRVENCTPNAADGKTAAAV